MLTRRSALRRLTAIVLATPVIGSFIAPESAHAALSTPASSSMLPPGILTGAATDVEVRWREVRDGKQVALSKFLDDPMTRLGESYPHHAGSLGDPILVFWDTVVHSVRHHAYCDHALNVRYIGEMATAPYRIVRMDCAQPHPLASTWSPDKILGHDMWFPAHMGAPWDVLWENRLVPANWAGIRYDRGGFALPRFAWTQAREEFKPGCWCGAPPPSIGRAVSWLQRDS